MANIILGGFLASVAFFIAGSALYMNPYIAGIYNKYKDHRSMKKWPTRGKYLGSMYGFILVQCLIFAFVYAFVAPVFPEGLLLQTIYFGLILTGIKIVPRALDMFMQTCYPNKLLLIEFINGTIGSFIIALVIVYFNG